MAATACAMIAAVVGGSATAGASGEPSFVATIEPISEALATEMRGVSWHPGCPVAIAELRLITMNHWGFDAKAHRGELVVHESVADDIVSVFGNLFDVRFPILRMERIELYGGDDDALMLADNTSAFNCRQISGGGSFSVHSWGLAIDINPVENPYIRDGAVLPPSGTEYLDRDNVRPGMIVDGDMVVQAFDEIGFIWGGHWDSLKDYQHFEIANVPAPTPGSGHSGAVTVACSAQPPASDASTGDIEVLDLQTGELATDAFNEFLSTAEPPVSTSPCDAARVLAHLDRLQQRERAVVAVESHGGGATVVVTVSHLADDSGEAVRYVLRFEDVGDGTIRLATGTWSVRCRPGRGHQDFTTEPCV